MDIKSGSRLIHASMGLAEIFVHFNGIRTNLSSLHSGFGISLGLDNWVLWLGLFSSVGDDGRISFDGGVTSTMLLDIDFSLAEIRLSANR